MDPMGGAGTVIVAASIVSWVLNSLTFRGGLHYIGEGIAVIFRPLGFGGWQAATPNSLQAKHRDPSPIVKQEGRVATCNTPR